MDHCDFTTILKSFPKTLPLTVQFNVYYKVWESDRAPHKFSFTTTLLSVKANGRLQVGAHIKIIKY
jgi:hypothetical protein